MEKTLCSPPKLNRTVVLAGTSAIYVPPPKMISLGKADGDLRMKQVYSQLQYPELSSSMSKRRTQQNTANLHGNLHLGNSDPTFTPPMKIVKVETSESPLSGFSQVTKRHQVSALDRKRSSLDMESALVDEAINRVLSLPQVVQEVALQQQDQTKELQYQIHVLQQNKDVLKNVTDIVAKLNEEASSNSRQRFLMEEDTAKLHETCKKLQADVEKLIEENEAIASDKRRVEDEIKHEEEKFSVYDKKMTTHVQLVSAYESDHPLQKALAEEEKKIQELKTRRTKLLNETHEIDDETQILIERKKVEQELLFVDKEIQEQEKELKSAKKKEAQIQKEIDVLHKRNAAQINRLRHQLKEVQTRNRQWNERATHLEKSIASLQQELS